MPQETAVSFPETSLHRSLPKASAIRQIDGVQFLRAVAVSLVVWLHASQHMATTSLVPGVFGVDIFFVISGFILATVVLRTRQTPGVRSAWHFFERRLIRIFPIYWLYCLLYTLRLKYLAQPIGFEYWPSLFLLPYPLYLRGRNFTDSAWTLVFEMFFYVMLSTVQVFTIRRALPVLAALLCGLALLGSLFSIQRPVLIVVASPMLLEFLLGVGVASIYLVVGRRRTLGMMLTFAGAVMPVLIERFQLGEAQGMQMVLADDHVFLRVATWGVAATLLVSGMVFWSPDLSGRFGRLGVAIGNSSYSTYLVEMLVIEVMARIFTRLLYPHVRLTTGVELATVALTYVTVLFVGYASYRFVELPLLESLRRRLEA